MDTRVVEKFLGGDAYGNVTGSCKLITINIGKQTSHILNEAGMVQTRFRETNETNLKTIDRLRPINPHQISAIILGHTPTIIVEIFPRWLNMVLAAGYSLQKNRQKCCRQYFWTAQKS